MQETPANIHVKLMLQETRVNLPTSLLLIVWVYIHLNFRSGRRKTHVWCNGVRNGRSRLSKVIGFGTDQKRVCNFLFVINSNLAPFQRYCRFSAENSHPTPIPPELWGCSPSTRLPMLGLRGMKTLR